MLNGDLDWREVSFFRLHKWRPVSWPVRIGRVNKTTKSCSHVAMSENWRRILGRAIDGFWCGKLER